MWWQEQDHLLPLLLGCFAAAVPAAAREENSLADKLSNLAMDTDCVVEQIITASVGCGGGTGDHEGGQRRQVAQQLAEAAQVDQDQR